MAKRRESRRKRANPVVDSEPHRQRTGALAKDTAGDDALMEMDAPSATMQSFAEYLSFRNAIIGLAVIQVLVIVILWPLHHRQTLETRITEGLQNRDYAQAYASLRRMDFWFGRDPDKFRPNEFIPSLIPNQRRLPSVTLRHYLDGAICLVEMGRLDEAAALLDRISPKAEAMSYYQRHRWKVPYVQGRILLAQGDQEGALDLFGQALAMNRSQPDLNFHAGKTLADLGRELEAALYLSQAARHSAHESEARSLLEDIRQRLTL